MSLQPLFKRQKRLEKKHMEKHVDFMTLFSKELSLRVFSHLNSVDLVQCAAVCSRWAHLANDEMLWKPLFYYRFHHSTVNGNRDSQRVNPKQRISAKRYGGSWKAKYRVYKNWLSDTISAGNDTRIYPKSQQLLQMTGNLILVVSEDRCSIDVWKYIKDDSKLICSMKSLAFKTVDITFVKLIDGSPCYLIAGYRNSGFALWEINTRAEDLDIKEIVTYNSHSNENNPVISIGMCFPIIFLCTESMEILALYVDKEKSIKPIQRLSSAVDWDPIHIQVSKYKSHPSLWRTVICFGLNVGNSGSSVGMQEIILSSNGIKSSQHVTALESEPFFFSSHINYQSHSDNASITSMAYSPPYLITAHPNNTIKQYMVSIKDHQLSVCFKRVLYGHTFRVEALSLKNHKLLSVDRSGIKVWNLLENKYITIHANKDQSSLQDLPFQHVKSVCFDEDRIAAFTTNKKKSFVRLWSFDLV